MANAVEINGFCDDRFENVKKVFAENFKLGLDIGASIAATLDGKFVIDLWGGYADAAKTRPWEENTIVNVFSTTKVMTAICVLMLVDRGLLDLDTPVAEYWPEFAQNGKEKLPVRYLLSHTSGIAGFNKRFPFEKLYNWEFCVKQLAAQKPWWEPGTKSGYHLFTFGFLLGELVKRVTGKTIGQFLREEVTEPLNADFHIGLSEENDSRVAELIMSKKRFIVKVLGSWVFRKLLFWHTAMKTLTKPNLLDTVPQAQTREWRAAEIPAANGHGNARSVARIGAAIACGGEVDGVRLLSEKTLEKALEEQISNKDKVLGLPIRFGLGFGIPSDTVLLPNPRTLYWGGFGGSIAFMDLDARVSAAFTMNYLNWQIIMDKRRERFINALYEAYETI